MKKPNGEKDEGPAGHSFENIFCMFVGVWGGHNGGHENTKWLKKFLRHSGHFWWFDVGGGYSFSNLQRHHLPVPFKNLPPFLE